MVFGLQTQPKSWLTGYTFWVNHYLEIVFSKISVVNPPPPLKGGGEGATPICLIPVLDFVGCDMNQIEKR